MVINRAFSWVLRILVSAVFIVSALAKLFAIDHFELYVYSFGFFSLSLSYLLARLCIAAELLLALFTLAGWFPRAMRLVAVLMLLSFSLFLCYSALIGRNESCQCFGQLVDLNPVQSLVKNAILLLLVLLYYRLSPPVGRPRLVVLPVMLALILLALPFVVSVPDNWAFGPSKEHYGEEALDQALLPDAPLAKMGVGRNRSLVAFVTPRCPYCKLARQKVTSILSRHHLLPQSVFFVQPEDIGVETFLDITHGARPLLMLLDSNTVVATYHLRNIDEDEIAHFLNQYTDNP